MSGQSALQLVLITAVACPVITAWPSVDQMQTWLHSNDDCNYKDQCAKYHNFFGNAYCQNEDAVICRFTDFCFIGAKTFFSNYDPKAACRMVTPLICPESDEAVKLNATAFCATAGAHSMFSRHGIAVSVIAFFLQIWI